MIIVAQVHSALGTNPSISTFLNSYSDFGVDGVKIQVHVTKDFKFLVLNPEPFIENQIHTVPLGEMTLSEVKSIRQRSGKKIFYELNFLDNLKLKGQIFLDLISDDSDAAVRLTEVIAAKPYSRKVIFTSAFCSSLEKIATSKPHLEIAYLAKKNTFLPMRFQSSLVSMNKTKAKIIMPESKIVTQNFMDQAKARNWMVIPWISLEDEKGSREYIWTYLKTVGVHGICTNFPKQLFLWNEETREDDWRHTQAKSELEARISSLNLR